MLMPAPLERNCCQDKRFRFVAIRARLGRKSIKGRTSQNHSYRRTLARCASEAVLVQTAVSWLFLEAVDVRRIVGPTAPLNEA